MKPTLWSVAGNYFSYEVCASFSAVSLASRAQFLFRGFFSDSKAKHPDEKFSDLSKCAFKYARDNIEIETFQIW